jgi:hypothetical protein
MTITIAMVLKKIDDDLAWRGIEDHDRKMGHVVLEREQAQYLRDWVITLINERDALVAEKEAQDGSTKG